MTTKFLGVLSIAVLSAALISPAAANTQDDIASCRDALAAQGSLDMDAYRLSFKKKKGNANRTLTLEAIPNAGGDKYVVTCKISKGEVTEVSAEQKA